MKHPDSLMINIDKIEIFQLLKHKMGRVIQDIGPRMILYSIEESLESQSIVQIFSRVQFITHIDPVFIKEIEDWLPPFSQFIECGFDDALRSLRPGVYRFPDCDWPPQPISTVEQPTRYGPVRSRVNQVEQNHQTVRYRQDGPPPIVPEGGWTIPLFPPPARSRSLSTRRNNPYWSLPSPG